MRLLSSEQQRPAVRRWAAVRASAPAFSFAQAVRMQGGRGRGGDALVLHPRATDDIGVSYKVPPHTPRATPLVPLSRPCLPLADVGCLP